ncbi:MAG: hypothetical protein LBQ79_10840 [Deltaproteobacteria bacterium]|jgi:ADP-heptose:LPS heptosyltransferase|nr:hypothetical protein [Deltaproteobacteria bacterium]
MLVQVLAPAKLGDFIQASALLKGIAASEPGAEIQVLALDPSVFDAQQLLLPEAQTMFLEAAELGIGGGRGPGSGGNEGGAAGPEGSGMFTVMRCERRPVHRGADLLVNLSVDVRAVRFAESLKPKAVLGPRAEGGGIWVPPAQRLAMAAMALDRRLGRLNITDVWRALWPGSPPELARPAFLSRPAGTILDDDELRHPIVLFHLGARGPMRRWPVERHVQLAAELSGKMEFHAVVLGSRAEKAMGMKFMRMFAQTGPHPQPTDLTGMTSLAELWPLMVKASLLVSSDTGVMHVGASAGVRQLALFSGPAYAPETGPYNDGSIVLQGLSGCGPCVEGKGCGRVECRGLPTAASAAAAAASLLEAVPPGDPAELSAGGRGVPGAGPEEWVTRIGPAGASLVPNRRFSTSSDDRALAALMFREGARAAAGLKAGPEDGAAEAAAELRLYGTFTHENIKKATSYLSFIERKALAGPDRKIFRDSCEAVLNEAVAQGIIKFEKAPVGYLLH